ncbi:S41 family peptidase [Desulfitobacterium hafniense]|uniref:Carboxyl-terminal protease n=2 Tax=Desulfitobacterium hafniense TaxID=49338 RepID=A0A098B4U4_DESHA|nr:S41 family peptidase [Desulfitobacterium hafniense]ACL22432.1 carboxyl-terminal protease [Desulfitobacterium hafniense DCB-2]KTE92252.1 carboxyl-terminal protease [Desulfitobacterium hafniense]CDX03395.1 Carboxyl-terminal-processing protease [Desulfitobacterium hafniense]
MTKFSMFCSKLIKANTKAGRILTASALALILTVSAPAAALGSPVDDVRSLLESQYVDPVDPWVLSASSVEEMLKRLDDPHTVFFTQKEYQNFLNSMDLSFSGIGVYIELEPRGLEIVGIIPGSPAEEAKLKTGDIIAQVGGQSLAGLSQDAATTLIKGPEGTTIDIVVLRGEERLSLKVARRAVEVPTVSGEMLNEDIGYVAIESFGETTEELFEQVIKELDKQGADAWVMDLRNNPGGYLDSALSLAGYFIGEQTALQTKDRSQKFEPYQAEKQEFIIAEPVIFLTNENSASASEILTAVVKDYQKAVVVGTNTYGKGSVQSLWQLTDGDVLKITVAKFYSPYGKEINGVGISPDVEILENDPLEMAVLMLAGSIQGNDDGQEVADLVQFTAGGKDWNISLEEARNPEYWSAYRELIQNNSFPGGFSWRHNSDWAAISQSEQDALWPLFYPGYHGMKELKDLAVDKTFTVRFTAPIDFKSVTENSFELIESESGKRMPVTFEQVDERSVKVIPQGLLEPEKTYWLLTHQGIAAKDGSILKEGALTVGTTGAGH